MSNWQDHKEITAALVNEGHLALTETVIGPIHLPTSWTPEERQSFLDDIERRYGRVSKLTIKFAEPIMETHHYPGGCYQVIKGFKS